MSDTSNRGEPLRPLDPGDEAARSKLLRVIAIAQEVLGACVERGVVADRRLDYYVREAWADLSVRQRAFETCATVVRQIPSELLVGHGLTGPQLELKMRILETAYESWRSQLDRSASGWRRTWCSFVEGVARLFGRMTRSARRLVRTLEPLNQFLGSIENAAIAGASMVPTHGAQYGLAAAAALGAVREFKNVFEVTTGTTERRT